MAKRMSKNDKLTYNIVEWLALIGAINWGLIGFFGFNLVTALLGSGTVGTTIIYSVVGLSGLGLLFYKLTGR